VKIRRQRWLYHWAMILSRDLPHVAEVKMPPAHGTFKQAQKARSVPEGQQAAMDFGAMAQE